MRLAARIAARLDGIVSPTRAGALAAVEVGTPSLERAGRVP
jgi:hypothetical protein